MGVVTAPLCIQSVHVARVFTLRFTFLPCRRPTMPDDEMTTIMNASGNVGWYGLPHVIVLHQASRGPFSKPRQY